MGAAPPEPLGFVPWKYERSLTTHNTTPLQVSVHLRDHFQVMVLGCSSPPKGRRLRDEGRPNASRSLKSQGVKLYTVYRIMKANQLLVSAHSIPTNLPSAAH